MLLDRVKRALPVLPLLLGLSRSVSAQGSPLYKYSAETGRCVDAQGRAGLNAPDAKALFAPPDVVERDAAGAVTRVVFRNRDGECADLSGADFNRFLRKPEFGAGYLQLDGWNLDGAKLAGARVSFYAGTLSLKGADLTGVMAGYVMFTVAYDRFTSGLEHCGRSDGNGHPLPAGVCSWKF